jgi:6-phosphogluconolactonase (cycloisomerase 2 family)
MAVDPSGRFAYAPSSPDGEPALFGWMIDQKSGALGSWLFYALGPRYEHISLDPSGKFAYFVEGPETNVKTIDARDGHWAAEYPMELRPFASTAVDPSGQFVMGVDETNNIVASYRINGTTGRLTEVWATSTGTRPFRIAVDPYGRFVFVANNASSNISVYKLDGSNGALKQVAGSPFPCGLNPVGITVEDSGRYLYLANKGTRDISGFAINGATGVLSPLPGSPFPTGVTGPLTSIVSVGLEK